MIPGHEATQFGHWQLLIFAFTKAVLKKGDFGKCVRNNCRGVAPFIQTSHRQLQVQYIGSCCGRQRRGHWQLVERQGFYIRTYAYAKAIAGNPLS